MGEKAGIFEKWDACITGILCFYYAEKHLLYWIISKSCDILVVLIVN